MSLLKVLNPRFVHSIFCGLCHVAVLVFEILTLIHLEEHHRGLFYASLVIYALSYLGEELSFIKKPIYLVLSLLGLAWFRLPYSIKFQKSAVPAVFAHSFEILGLVYAGVTNAYYIYEDRIIPLYYSIPFFIIVCIYLPIIYDGTLFTPEQTIPLATYFLLLWEIFLNYSFYAALMSMNRFWIVYACWGWRILILFEPFAFWASLHSFVSPFRAFTFSQGSRSLIVIYMLHFEFFMYAYCGIWFAEQTIINRVIIYFLSVYFLIFLCIEIFAPGFPYTHKVRSISTAHIKHTPMSPAVI